MRHAKTWYSGAVLVLGLLAVSCRREGGEDELAARPGGAEVEAEAPERRDFTRTARWWGRCVALRVPVRAPIAGRVTELPVADGVRVAAGDLIARLAGPRVEAETVRLEAAVPVAEEAATLAKATYEREEQAFAEQLGTAAATSASLAVWKEKEAALASARRALAAFRVSVAVTAPRAGRFSERQVHVGQDVREGDGIAEIVDSRTVWIEAHTFVEDSPPLEGVAAVVDRSGLEARVALVYATRARDGSLRVRIEGIEGNEGIEGDVLSGALAPGEPLEGRLILEIRRNALSLPACAVVRDEAGTAFVFVVTDTGHEQRTVTVGLEEGGRIEVRSGLGPEERVVTTGAYQLFHRAFRSIYREED